MKHGTMVMICRILMVSLMFLTFQTARAGMIGTGQIGATGTQADRAAVVSMIDRSDVSQQLQALGIEPQAAKDRVAAMTDNEVQALSNKLQTVPAGGMSDWWIGAIVVAVVVAIAFGYWKTGGGR